MPADPIRLQVVARIAYVLRRIAGGASFFFTPGQVATGFIASPTGYPVYEVVSDSGGPVENFGDYQARETFFIAILGTVQDTGDIVTPLERALRDVRKAITDDLRPEAGAGSLGTLVTWAGFDSSAEIHYGLEGTGFFGFFSQRVKVILSGEFGEL